MSLEEVMQRQNRRETGLLVEKVGTMTENLWLGVALT